MKNETNPMTHSTETKKMYLSLLFFPILGLLMVLLMQDPHLWTNYKTLVTSPAVLLSDYVYLFGPSAALLNASIVFLINLTLFYKLSVSMNGLFYATLFTVFGFSFLGMNPINLMPIYLGGYLYTLYNKIEFRSTVLIVVIAGTLGPIISHLMFGYGFPYHIGYGIGLLVGVFLGFIIIPMGRHLLRFHDGFNLYNIGFTGGILALLFNGAMKTLSHTAVRVRYLHEVHDPYIIAFVFLSILYWFFLSWRIQRGEHFKWKELFESSGRAISDFIEIAGVKTSYLNMAIFALILSSFVLLVGAHINGLMMAAIYTNLGFGAFGKHLKNTSPVLLGAIGASLLLGLPFTSTLTLSSILFSSTLAPIAGNYGWAWGAIAGFSHIFVVGQVGDFYSGLNLYNNGFAGGLVAFFIINMIQIIRRNK